MQHIQAWRALEERLKARGLHWAIHRLPAQLRVARTPEFHRGVEIAHLLPADYTAFVDELGFPVIGFGYHSSDGLTFLPPEHIASISANLVPPVGAKAKLAFFAGTDLADPLGVAFAPSPGGELGVWRVCDGRVDGRLGTFSEWVVSKSGEITAHVDALSADDLTRLEQENKGDDDPHRALDYALYQDAPHEGFSAADLNLHWVEDQATTPYTYGLIDETGAWLIPLKKKYDYVAPFRDGRAIVKDGRGRRYIDTAAKSRGPAPVAIVERPNHLDSASKKFAVVGGLDMSRGQFQEHVEKIGGVYVEALSAELDYVVVGRCKHFPDLAEDAKRAQRENPGMRLLSEKEFVEESGFEFPTL